MLEIYLFINPIESYCLQSERNVLQLVEEHHKKIQFGFLPLLNLQTVHQMMRKMNISDKNLMVQNQLFQSAFAASLDFKAAEVQGKKKGREFLLNLQQRIMDNNLSYHDALALDVAKEVKLDMDMFMEERRSNAVKDSFFKDQQVASEMGIRTHPSAVIFDTDKTEEYGLLVEDCHSLDLLREVCSNYTHQFQQRVSYGHEKGKRDNHPPEDNIVHFL